jgi:hypothetical protein
MSLETAIEISKLNNIIKTEKIDDFLRIIACLYSKDEKQYKNMIKIIFINVDVIGPLKLQILFNDEWYETSDVDDYYYYRKQKLYMD